MSDDSTAVFPVLAVRKVLDTVLSVRVHGVRCLLRHAAAAVLYFEVGTLHACSNGTRPKKQQDVGLYSGAADIWSCCRNAAAAETGHSTADDP